MVAANQPWLGSLSAGLRYGILAGAVLSVACTGGVDPEPGETGETALPGVSLSAIGFNIEGDDSLSREIGRVVAEQRGEALWGFSEVTDEDAIREVVTNAADEGGEAFSLILGTSGSFVKLALAYDPSVLTLLDTQELSEAIGAGGGRAPLVGHFLHEASGQELKVVVNHLWRTDDDARQLQADRLNTWAQGQSLPLLTIGDFNFDWTVPGGETDHDTGYDLLIADDVWRWVKPEVILPTQCSTYNSVLDFGFVAGPAKDWDASSTILYPEDTYCPDNDKQSDHRPVRVDLVVPRF